jgi:small subunit ribosomal protein SAe
MSSGYKVLEATADDYEKMLMAKTHLGAKNCNHQMTKYVYGRRKNGTNVIDIRKTFEKLVFAARVIAAIPDAKDVCVISGRVQGQRAVLKFAKHIGASAIAGRYTPGTFTNQIQKAFQEPRLLIVTDPYTDHQSIRESAYVNLPTVALCNTDTPLRYVDIAIPCNNRSKHSIGLIWWMLAREVLRLRGSVLRSDTWDIMPDLYFYRSPAEIERDERSAQDTEEVEEVEEDNQVADWDAEPAAEEEWAEAAPEAAEQW